MDGTLRNFLKESALELGAARGALGDGHWRYGVDDDGIGWLVLNCEGSSANTISDPVLRELDAHLQTVEADTPRALVVRSAKPSGFAMGADIDTLADMDAAAAEQLLTEAHRIIDRLEGLSCPTIAVVHGAALGAGFELALACDYRIAIDGASFGLPEVRLGLHPGLGGTVRLPELIEPTSAMQMMLTGSTAHTAKARALGIADLTIEERHLHAAIQGVLDGKVEKGSRGLMARAFALSSARALAAARMRQTAQSKAPQDHYPAPHALIAAWEKHGDDPEAMRKAEIASFAELLQSQTSRNLIRAFFLRRKLKQSATRDHGITDVHVIGAGVMGAEIAIWIAMQGKRVTVSDPDDDALGAMIRQATKICDGAHKTALETRDTLDRLMPDPQGHGIARADLVIEAGPEKPELKASILADIGKRMKTGAILASNTSSLRLADFIENVPAKTRFAGLHFFNPVSKVPLVEVVSQEKTGKETRERLLAFCTAIDRLPVAVTDAPGFLVNRALMPYLLEALLLIDEGIPKERIDKAALNFGMPMGPVTLADQVGLDICLDVAESLAKSLKTPIAAIPSLLRDKVEAGNLGRKSGRGFYSWENGTPQPDSNATIDETMTDRLILPMLNACAECVRTQVVDSADEADAAMIFATGFAPFRGGPLHYGRTRGHQIVHQRLQELEKAHGPRFKPDPYWRDDLQT
ncbi:MAG: 3-hydroxyacyl-CoA dehydrogenase NAD-binding domain-containing protein [Pararhodobacter sp.]